MKLTFGMIMRVGIVGVKWGGTLFLLFLSNILIGQNRLDSKLEYVTQRRIETELGDAVVKGKVAMSWPFLVWFDYGRKGFFVYNIETKNTSKLKVKGRWHDMYINNGNIIDVEDVGGKYKCSLYTLSDGSWKVDSSWVSKQDISSIGYHNGLVKEGAFYINDDPSIKIANRFYSLNDFSYPIMLHNQPKTYIDYTESLNMICDPGKYEITLLDNELKVRETIKYEGADYYGINDSLYSLIKKGYKYNSPANSFGDLRRLETSSDNVWSAQFINDSAIWVKRTVNFGKKETKLQMVFDFWVKDGDWKLAASGMNDNQPLDTDIIGKDCLSFRLGEYGCKYFIENGKLYVLKIEMPKDVQGMNYGEYLKSNNDWFFDNPLSFKLYEYQIIL